jgi:DNA-binding transcriptional MerR regulator
MGARRRPLRMSRKMSENALLTLEQVARKSGISTPTLRRYGQLYRDRIPSVGSGRRKRYPESAVAVFQKLKRAGRRGRRPQVIAAGTRTAETKAQQRVAAAAAKGRSRKSGDLLTLGAIRERTGISYATLVRYVRLYLDRLPHEGKGRARRFRPEAVATFQELRKTRAGGQRAFNRTRGDRYGEHSVLERIEGAERKQQDLEKWLSDLAQQLERWL